MFGGFPADLEMPFGVFNKVKMTEIQGFKKVEEINKKIELLNRYLMVKRGIISKVFPFNISGKQNEKTVDLVGSVMYFDNVMHTGGSGGPIINSDGKLIGIITDRAVIELNYEDSPKGKIPSGSGLAISCDVLLQFLGNSNF